MLNRLRLDRVTETMRINRLLEADIATLDERLEQFLFRPRQTDSDRARERRSEPRYASETKCEVSVTTPGTPFSSQGAIADISRSGLGLVMPCAMTLGLDVRVRFGRLVILGTVRYSHQNDNGAFHIGIVLRDVFEDDAVLEESAPDERPN